MLGKLELEMRKYAYFPGCSLHAIAIDYGESTLEVAKTLGVQLQEIPNWICCGATPAHATNDLLSVAMPVRNLIDAKKISNELVVCCAACYSRFKFANKYIKERPELKKDVEDILGEEYSGDVKVRHFLDILINDVGLDRIKELIKNDLKGLKVVSYYGCLLIRPPKVTEFDDPENPVLLDNLIGVLGGEIIDWPYKNECCGASFSLTKQDIVLKLAGDILKFAKDKGAECIAVVCPFCQANLDMREGDISKRLKVNIDIPVLYFTQLLGLALGIEPQRLDIGKQMVLSNKLLKEKGILV
jgi:heterodisulfide reductase subunit B